LGADRAPQTSHEGNWCQASIALRHGTCCRLIWSPRQPRLFFSHSISITYRCGPCGVVGDALASSKRSGKSTGFRWPPTPPLARQCVLAALHGDECMDKLKRRCGQSEGSSPLGASSRRKWVHRGAVRCRIRGSSPSVDCGFDARRTSHSVAVHRAASTTIPHSGGHRAREGGSTLYIGISQPLFATVRPPGSNAADQASWNSR
jgi:hypothetical protein